MSTGARAAMICGFLTATALGYLRPPGGIGDVFVILVAALLTIFAVAALLDTHHHR